MSFHPLFWIQDKPIAKIEIQTIIHAPIERCFDLSRSIDLHKDSVSHTRERAVSGIITGIIGFGEEVEWRARHFGLWLSMRVRITAFNRPIHFQDVMVKGPFRFFQHDHLFNEHVNGTVMVDRISFAAPLPLVGRIVELLVLKNHLQRFLEQRTRTLKSVAESDQWHKYLSAQKL